MQAMVVKNLKETKKLAKKFIKSLKGGEVILFNGDLGAGKTTFTQFCFKCLGVKEPVTSPTFTIVREYKTKKFDLYHFDMYRLSSIEEAESLGFEEYFDTKNLDGISLVEWPEQVEGLIKSEHTEIEIKKLDDEKREIIIRRKS